MPKAIAMPERGMGGFDNSLDDLAEVDAGQAHIAACLGFRIKPLKTVRNRRRKFEAFPDGSVRVLFPDGEVGVYRCVDDIFLSEIEEDYYDSDNFDIDAIGDKWDRKLGFDNPTH